MSVSRLFPRSDPRQRGFSLLEILVAFVILAVSLGTIMRIFSSSLRNIGDAERRAQAVAVAESVLAGLGVEKPLTDGEISGEAEPGYRWSARVTPHVGADAVFDAVATPVELKRIDLDVTRAGAGEAAPVLRLTTLRAVPKP